MNRTVTPTPEQDHIPPEGRDLSADAPVGEAAHKARQTLAEVRSAAQDFIQRSAHMMRDGRDRAREAASRTADRTSDYVQAQPLKSLLIAAAAGAAIAVVAGMLTRSRR